MENQPPNLFDLQIDGQSSQFLLETARWAKFLSIVGFVMSALLILFGLSARSIIALMVSSQWGESAGIASVFFSIVFVIIALLYFFPCFYLFNFSSKMQLALRTNDQVHLNGSFKNLKSCMRFVGIFTIVMLSFYILVIILSILGAGFR
jgi:hypothetical protein